MAALSSFQSQPGSGSYNVAYRPIILTPGMDSTYVAPVVYCDVYIGSTLVRTLTSTTPAGTSPVLNFPYWRFDIQDVLQEYLSPGFPLGNSIITPTTEDLLQIASSYPRGSTRALVQCKFRSSIINTDGFIEPQNENLASNSFYVFNSVLQQEANQDFLTHLNYYSPVNYYSAFPLTHRVDGYINCVNDQDFYPFVIRATETPFDETSTFRIRIDFKINNSNTVIQARSENIFMYPYYHMPLNLKTGISQLRTIAGDWENTTNPGVPYSIDWDNITEYRVHILCSNATGGVPLLTTTWFKSTGCGCCDNRARIRFLNYLGYWDSVSFCEIEEKFKTASETWQKGLSPSFNYSDRGLTRFNVKSNEEYTVQTKEYGEAHQEWLKELFATPQAYLEVILKEDNNNIAYIPIIITDGDFITKKVEGRYEYLTTLSFKMANENIHHRT